MHSSTRNAAARVATLVALALAAGAQQPAPRPQQDKPPEKDKTERVERQDAQRTEPRQEQRAQQERTQQEQTERARQEQRQREERAQREREQQGRAREAGAPRATVPARLREKAQVVADQQFRHRSRLARMRRLEQLYREKGDQEKLAKVQQLMSKEQERFGRWMGNQEKQVGSEDWGRIQRALGAPKPGQAPAGTNPNRGREEPPRREQPPRREEPQRKEGGGQ